ncbi:hypothetical protein C0J52_14949 [Blattella germanica]|nr:hypothetical protein C0J52_14949 [Blattella germanica]
MTTKAMNKDKRYRNMEKIKIATCNVRGLTNKEEELLNDLKKMNIDIGIITETKKKLKGTTEYRDYLLLYSGNKNNKRKLNCCGIYAPEEGKKEESLEFYETLQLHLNAINKTDYISIAGDFNARVGQQIMGRLVGNNGEPTLNENGRGTKSIIDYILVNKKLVQDTRVYQGCDISSDHF